MDAAASGSLEPFTHELELLGKSLPVPSRPSDLHLQQLEQETLYTFREMQRPAAAIFTSLSIAQDGGIAKIPSFYERSRFLGAFIFLVGLVLNVRGIIANAYYRLGSGNAFMPGEQGLFFPDWHMEPAILAVCELLGMLVLMCMVLLKARVVAYGHPSDMGTWKAVVDIFWNQLPLLSSFSALRMLQYAHFKFISAEVQRRLAVIKAYRAITGKASVSATRREQADLVFYVGSRLVMLLLACEAFVLKFTAASEHVQLGHGVLPILLLLHQIIGIVNVPLLAFRRLEGFIFGGDDGIMDFDELVVKRAYNYRLAQKIWEASVGRRLAWLALMITWGDSDFQGIILTGNLSLRIGCSAIATKDSMQHNEKRKSAEGGIEEDSTQAEVASPSPEPQLKRRRQHDAHD